MKNIVKVCRIKDNTARLYQLPLCVALERGTPVEVELADGSTAMGVTVSASYCGEYEERLLRDVFSIQPTRSLSALSPSTTSRELNGMLMTLMKPPTATSKKRREGPA